MNDLIEILKYTIPSIITGGVAAYFLRQMIVVDSTNKKIQMLKEKKEHSLPIRLQAYERMTLFLERIALNNLSERIDPLDFNKIEYAKLLIAQVNSEFEHNLVQQIYVGKDCWSAIVSAKQTTLNMITAESMKPEISSGKELQQVLTTVVKASESPTEIALHILHQEVQKLF